MKHPNISILWNFFPWTLFVIEPFRTGLNMITFPLHILFAPWEFLFDIIPETFAYWIIATTFNLIWGYTYAYFNGNEITGYVNLFGVIPILFIPITFFPALINSLTAIPVVYCLTGWPNLPLAAEIKERLC